MTVRDVCNIIESWAPREIAWEQDNVGLQVGRWEKRVRRILVALDASDEVVAEARKKRIDLIITHHPLFFHRADGITTDARVGRLAYELVRNDIALYSAHTNLDVARGGVSVVLAEKLGLKDITPLVRRRGDLRKVVVFVPVDHVDAVTKAMASAGAGVIGKYDLCSFRSNGTGTFRAMEGATPFIGQVGKFEKVDEVRLEMIVPQWKLGGVLRSMQSAHPYEEVAYDVYRLDNELPEFGAGAIGRLHAPIAFKRFLRTVKTQLGTPALRFTGSLTRSVSRVAVCGGSGSDFIDAAVQADADVFVTADVRYHSFEAARGRIALVDAGHYETEVHVLVRLINKLKSHPSFDKKNVAVSPTVHTTNPIQYY